jgi:non-ribosomal peptide synthetase component E (peptide arylation enzyme)
VRPPPAALPGLVVVGGWGQSEDALVTLGIPGDPDEKLIDTDGYPWPGMRIRVVDEDGTELPPGTDGRLQVTGPFLFVGYAERLEMTRESFDGEWFDTGDLATIDADGYLSISGRTKDVIIRGGENIPVAYVENVLYEHPDIVAVAVVGTPDPRLQERACACVVLTGGATLTFADMQAFLADKGVAKQYWPERLEVLDELPRTPSGKIQKFKLREQVSR